jgi:hypothetical protein
LSIEMHDGIHDEHISIESANISLR